MSITVVGSIAFDAVETPHGERDRMLGGAATYFSLAASMFDQVNLVGPVGDDFGEAEMAVLRTRGANVDDVERVAGGRSFFWKGRYHENMDVRDTLDTQLGVFEHFEPKLSAASREAEVLFLANIQPGLQLQVREQCERAGFVALDSMDLWINVAGEELREIIGRVDCLILNDEELRLLTGKPNLYTAAREILGWPSAPTIIVAKQGGYGATLITAESFFSLPAYPLEIVVDPTGAGDTFAGGFVGYIASQAGDFSAVGSDEVLRNAMAYGTALASFTVQRFGTEALQAITPEDVTERVADLWSFGRFERIDPQLRR